MLSLEITSIKNMRLFLEVADQLGYEDGKVRLVLNRADSASASGSRTSSTRSAARSTTRSSATVGAWSTPSTEAYRSSSSTGRPQVSQDILRLATAVAGERVAGRGHATMPRKAAQKKSLFAWR